MNMLERSKNQIQIRKTKPKVIRKAYQRPVKDLFDEN